MSIVMMIWEWQWPIPRAVQNGAAQVESAINGLGGSAVMLLEEITMAIRTRGDVFKASTRIETDQIYRTNRLVSSTGVDIAA